MEQIVAAHEEGGGRGGRGEDRRLQRGHALRPATRKAIIAAVVGYTVTSTVRVRTET
jgi:hypothetical protein